MSKRRRLVAPFTLRGLEFPVGCDKPQASQGAKPYERFERPDPNDLWQIDFKGEFRMTSGQCYYSVGRPSGCGLVAGRN
jgi:hypothetical protein